jgi:flagellar basal body-associated protein FliL
MASKEPKEEKKEAKEEVESPKKGGMLKLIILGVAVLALVAGGFFGWRMWSARKAAKLAAEVAAKQAAEGGGTDAHGASAEDEEEEDAAAGGGHGGAAGAAVLVLKPIVNLEGPRKNAFLKCELHILFRDPELGKLAAGDKPTVENSTIRATVLESLSGKSVEEAADPETRETVRKDLKDKLNEKFKPKLKAGEKEDPKHKPIKRPIKDVLVVDWAIAQ